MSEKTQETTKLLELADIEIDLGNDKFNKVVSDIKFVRERLLKKVVSPDEEKSQKSKKNKRKSKFPGGAANTSGGFGSINDSQLNMDGLSVMDQHPGMTSSIADKSQTFWTSKVKPRDFKFKSNILAQLGAENYDAKEDINAMKLNIEETIIRLRVDWKQMDMAELKAMIKRQVIAELCRIEERKQVRRDHAELQKKKKAKAEAEQENKDLSMV